jgi:hypothetical protein
MDPVSRGSGLYIPLARHALQSLNLPLPNLQSQCLGWGLEAWLRIAQSYWIVTRHWEVSLLVSFNNQPGTRSFKGVPEQFDVLSCTELSQHSLAPTNPRERASAGDTDYWANH